MNEKTIMKLKKRFTITAFFSFVAVMISMCALIYFINFHTTRQQVRKTLDYIIDNDGIIPEIEDAQNRGPGGDNQVPKDTFDIDQILEDLFSTGIRDSTDFFFTIRYFSVIFEDGGNLSEVMTNHIAAIDSSAAKVYGKKALDAGKTYGTFGNYYYKMVNRDDGSIIVAFVDYSNQKAATRRIGTIAIMLSLLGSILTFIFVKLFSGRMIKPELENAENQKQFITNASHELKTPLAVIKANTEIDMMMNGENDWNKSTMRQVDHLTGLIQNLVMISRAEERESEVEMTAIDISKAISDTIDIFEPVATQDGKSFVKNIPEDVMMVANESQIRQLVSLLVDNAIKYCDDEGIIGVTLSKRGRNNKITVFNDYAAGENIDYDRFFDRFYREDKSHNIDKGGYGIGLSIAESLVKQYKGKISVSWKSGIISFTCNLKG